MSKTSELKSIKKSDRERSMQEDSYQKRRDKQQWRRVFIAAKYLYTLARE